MSDAREKLEKNARLRREGGLLRDFRAMHWDEPLIMEMGRSGERGVIPPQATDVAEVVAPAEDLLPATLVRSLPPALPELSQPQVLRHYTRLSQMTLGVDVTIDIGDATDIHPANKVPVGTRLALAARVLAYGEQREYSGPVFQKLVVADGHAVLQFTHLGGGLVYNTNPV